MILVLCGLYIILAIVGDASLKLFADGRDRSLPIGMLVHATASGAWAFAMRYGASFGRSAAVLILANLAGAVLLDRYAFGAALEVRHVVGLALSTVAIVLLA